jgi:hypothetical protein
MVHGGGKWRDSVVLIPANVVCDIVMVRVYFPLKIGKIYFATQFRYPATHFRKSPKPISGKIQTMAKCRFAKQPTGSLAAEK